MTLFYSFPFTGLSPLARGTHFNPHLFLLLRRFIPAGAGNTGSTRPRRAAAPVYPRWRGEHLPAIYLPVAAFGLSPLARGTLLPIASRARIARFIPAGAGNTMQYTPPQSFCTVYPRWRGEHYHGSSPSRPGNGLSPLARGTRQHGEGHLMGFPVYPRWRGEHFSNRLNTGKPVGLSPLARGTQISQNRGAG